MDSYYANILAYRVTANEFVLEFGNFFVGQENRTSPEAEDFDIRVVMIPELIEPLINILQQAKEAHEKHKAAMVEKAKG